MGAWTPGVVLLHSLVVHLAGALPRSLGIAGRDFVDEATQPVRLHAGEVHYFRVPEVHWEDRLQRLRAMGLNAVSTYVPWNWHEEEEGSFDFQSDRKNINKFLELARKQDLMVIFRPGPYICAEWEYGGLPSWLLGKAIGEGFQVRTGDPTYLAAVDRFWGELLPRVRPHLLEHGGSIAMLQLENEYGHWGDATTPSDKLYFVRLLELARKHLGTRLLLITTDDDEAVAKGRGGLPDVYAAVNFGPWQESVAQHLDKVFSNARKHNGEAPELVMELWAGWFQMWQHDESTERQFRLPGRQLLAYIEALLRRNASFTLYMAHGGTNFGLWPSAGFRMPEVSTSLIWRSGFVSTSYDYAAPIPEDGRHGYGSDGVDKYTGIRELLLRFKSPADLPFPEEPPGPRLGNYPGVGGPSGEVLMQRRAALRDPAALAALRGTQGNARSQNLQSMEMHGQQTGMVLYRHQPDDELALGRAVRRWYAEGSGQAPRLWPRAVVAACVVFAGVSFVKPNSRSCRCCSVGVVAIAVVVSHIHQRWSGPDSAPLVLKVRDRVTVWHGDALVQKPYLNLDHVCCPWDVKDVAVSLLPDASGSLDILVENLGRRAFMPRGYMGEVMGLRQMWYDWKGLVSARVGHEALDGQWDMIALPLKDLHRLNGSAPAASPEARAHAGPTFFEGEVHIPPGEEGPFDTYLRLESGPWQTGMAFVNGFNLGRYWRGAPAPLNLYVPKSALRKGQNLVVLLEMEPDVDNTSPVLRLAASRE